MHSLRSVPFLDLRVLDRVERQALVSAFERVLDHGRIVLGPEVSELEGRIARICEKRHGIGVNSGSDALFFALKALEIGPGDEVVTTSLSWIATANAIALTGATPVFADIRDDLNIDPQSVSRLIGPRTKALLPVHYTGKVANMFEITEIARENRLLVIEDAAQSFGAGHRGQKAGSFGDIACFSMNPMKVLAGLGEAGMIVTDSDKIRERILSLRYNGTILRETCIEPSRNGRIDTLQAALILARLDFFEDLIARRRENARLYDELLAGLVDTPEEGPGDFGVYYTYTIRADRRDELARYLEEKGIETKIQHPILMPEQPAYRDSAKGEWTNAQRMRDRILCLPANEKLSSEQIRCVARQVQAFYETATRK